MRKDFEVTIINGGDHMVELSYEDEHWNYRSTITCSPYQEWEFTRSFNKESMISLKWNLLYVKAKVLPKDYKLQVLIRLLPEG